MRARHIVFKELTQRKVRLFTGLTAILLAVAVIVCVQSISISSKEELARQLRNLGPNMFVLPQSLRMEDFYTADYGAFGMPESYLYRLSGAGLEGVDRTEGRLAARIALDGHKAILTGGSAGFLSLGPTEISLGAEIAKHLHVKEGGSLQFRGREFTVRTIRPEAGTVEDITMFAPLDKVQEILETGRQINAIEVIATGDRREKLAEEIQALLPGTKVVTKRRIAQAQADAMSALRKYSSILLILIVLIGGFNIANYMLINVRERRREIGTLLALGATPGWILRIFLRKAAALGFLGGMGGYVLGTVTALFLGTRIVQASVRPLPEWTIWSVGLAMVFSLISSAFPAWKASRLDPAQILQEE